MEEEILMTLLTGFGAGWFLKTAFIWRRDAKKVLPPEVRVVTAAAPPPPPAPTETRIERLLEKMNQRLEALEDRIDFTERLLDTRSSPRLEPLETRRGLSSTSPEGLDQPRR
jgi:hypothetical protein